MENAFTYVDFGFGEWPEDGVRYIGDAYTFRVSVEGGTGPFTYQWQRELGYGWETTSTVSSSARTSEYPVNPLAVSDTGSYRCQVAEDGGPFVVTREAALTVRPHLAITKQPSDAGRYAGESVSFSVSVTGGIGEIRYRWQRDEEDITNGVADEATYTIPVVAEGDVGLYRCIVSDEGGDECTSDAAHLSVSTHLRIETDPADLTQYAGEAAVFSVGVVGGQGACTYVWQFEREDLPGAPNAAILPIASVAHRDAGFYRCIVTDESDESQVSGEAELIVVDHVEVWPDGGSTAGGESVVVHVLGFALADAPQTAVAFGAGLATALDVEVVTPGEEYRIACMTPAQPEGPVEVTVTNLANGTSVSRADGFRYGNYYIHPQPESARGYVGASVSFTAGVIGGVSDHTFTWQGDVGSGWQDLLIETRTLGVTTFVLGPLAAWHAGVYRCIAQDGASRTAESRTARLHVYEHIEVTQDPVPAFAYVGDQAMLAVQAVGGIPKVHYEWRKNGVAAIGAPDARVWWMPPLTEDDSGDYACYVWDAGGDSDLSESAALSVVPHVAIDDSPEGGAFYLGDPCTLTVIASGGQGAKSYVWQKDLGNLDKPNQPWLDLGPLAFDEAGAYRCVVSDEGSDVRISADAEIAVAPHVAVTASPEGGLFYSGDTHLLAVTAEGGIGQLDYQWQKDGGDIEDENKATLPLESMTPLMAGVYRCLVSDEETDQVASDEAHVDIAEHLTVEDDLANARCYVDEPHTFSVNTHGGRPPVRYQWWSDSGTIEMATSSELPFEHVRHSDAGHYWCVIEDAGNDGYTTAPASLAVFDPIAIVADPADATRYPRQECLFSVEATGGMGARRYRWLKDGDGVEGANEPLFRIAKVVKTDEGEYWCEVSDDRTSVDSGHADLFVEDAVPGLTPSGLFGLVAGGAVAMGWRWRRRHRRRQRPGELG